MKSYAIVQASGRQFWIEENRFYDLDKLPLKKGDTFIFNKILFLKDVKSTHIGKPFLNGDFKIEATVLRHLSSPKIRVYKMRPKKKTRKTFGHRQKLTRILINSIKKTTDNNCICYI